MTAKNGFINLGLKSGVILQDDLHLISLEKKLSYNVGLLSKSRHCVPKRRLKTIYYSIFNSHLIYACEIWGQNQNNLPVRKLIKLKDKALRPINFQPLNATTRPLYHDYKLPTSL